MAVKSSEVFDKNTLEKIKKRLLDEQERLNQELASIGKKSKKVTADYDSSFPEMGDKEDENAMEVAAYSNRLPLERQLESQLKDVVNALKRLDNDTYGICKYCNNPISIERLMARPESSSCISCKKELQSRPKIS